MKHLGPLLHRLDGGSVYVVEVTTRDRTRVAKGVVPDPFDNDTSVIGT